MFYIFIIFVANLIKDQFIHEKYRVQQKIKNHHVDENCSDCLSSQFFKL